MGILRRIDGSSADISLSAMTRIGRASTNDLVLSEARVSQFHASLAWTSQGVWELRDLGSSNGSFVDGVRLGAGDRKTLSANAGLSFGAPGAEWSLIDVRRPLPEARELATGTRHVGTPHLLSVTKAGTTVDIFEEGRGNWVIESDGVLRDLRNDEIIELGGTRFLVALPLPISETEDAPGAAPERAAELPLAETTLTFLVSADLETIELQVTWSGRRWVCQKAYVRALLSLAEARLRDAGASSVRTHERGWVYGDELCTLASYESVARLNVEVHRARSEFAREGVPGAPAIVQRRRGTGQLRIGTDRIEVVHGLERPRRS